LDDGAHTSGERSAGARLTDLVASVAPAAVSAVRAASRPPRVLTGRAPRPSSLSAVEPSAGAANDAPATFEEIRGTRRTIVNEATP
jgi:hypothetical protein